MKTPTIFQWYQILRRRYQFTVFQAVRSALWLARGTSSDSKRLCGIDAANQPLIESAQDRSDAGSRSGMNSPIYLLGENLIETAMHPCPKK
jgi:hypothetical protein